MTIEIPDAAVEAVAKAAMRRYESENVLGDGATWEEWAPDARADLEAALPQLQAAILADLRERCEGAAVRLSQAAQDATERHEIYRLAGKVEGVKLVVSYIGDAERMGQ